jgi:hypothetical protein
MPSCNRVLGGAATEAGLAEAAVTPSAAGGGVASVGTLGTNTREEAAVEVDGAEPEGRPLVSCIASIGNVGARKPGAIEEVSADIEHKSDACVVWSWDWFNDLC